MEHLLNPSASATVLRLWRGDVKGWGSLVVVKFEPLVHQDTPRVPSPSRIAQGLVGGSTTCSGKAAGSRIRTVPSQDNYKIVVQRFRSRRTLQPLFHRNCQATTDVHCAQRLAAAGMALRHSGHDLVAGAEGGGGMKRFTCLMIKKITKATITNSMTVLMKMP